MTSRRRRGYRQARSESRSWGWMALGALALLLLGGLWWLLGAPGLPSGDADTAERRMATLPGEELSIWFASPEEDALVSESRRVPPTSTPSERALTSLQELIAGPGSKALRTVAAEVKIRALFIDDQGTAYVDFSEALSQSHPGGPWAEMLTLRSIIQTLVANVPEIKRVQLLIEGREVETLAGHLDLRRPLDATWVMHQP